ncbi:MAG: OB-fold nucleic acid binding domain-containing protein, partial [Agathobacter sp.]|nr:OB-fold nucleic acid binding domain-containing protein [Agathobacter sp.]
NKTMAFITVEDLTGTIEVIIFPRDYDKYQGKIEVDSKVYIVGHVSVEDEQNGKIICEKVIPFDEVKKELWLQFASKEEYAKMEGAIYDLIKTSDGNDEIVIYVKDVKAIKRLGKNYSVKVENGLIEYLNDLINEENVKVVEKNIENIR